MTANILLSGLSIVNTGLTAGSMATSRTTAEIVLLFMAPSNESTRFLTQNKVITGNTRRMETKRISRRQWHQPDGDVVVDGLGAQHGEVDVDAVAGRHPDAPHTVLEVGVLLRVARGVNGSVQGGDVAAAQGCQRNRRRKN